MAFYAAATDSETMIPHSAENTRIIESNENIPTVPRPTVEDPKVMCLQEHVPPATADSPCISETKWDHAVGESSELPGTPYSEHQRTSIISRGSDWWWWELSGALLGAGIVAATAIILYSCDGKPQPRWHLGITINGLVVVLATIAKAALMLAVTTAISQLKWIWFHSDNKGRKLNDIEVFDGASRGPLGSLILMWKLRAWSIAFLGAIIVVASVFFAAATQNAITIAVRNPSVASDAVKVSRIKSFTDLTYLVPSRVGMSDPLGRAIMAGIIDSTGEPNLKPTCPTASCSWPSFASLAICSRCLDITAEARAGQNCSKTRMMNDLVCNLELPDSSLTLNFSYAGDGPSSYFNSTTYLPTGLIGFYISDIPGLASTFAGIKDPIFAFQSFDHKISQSADEEFHFDLLSATECSLYVCVKTYNVSVMNGESHQEIISTWYNGTQPFTSGSYMADLCLKPPKSHNNHSDGPYKFDGGTLQRLGEYLYLDYFRGTISVSNASDLSAPNEILPWIYSQANLSQVVENVALSLTDYIQTSEGSEIVLGKQSVQQVYVHIRWWWLAFPVAVALVSLAFLLLTILVTEKTGTEIWKYSSLALLYHGLNTLPANEAYPLDKLSQLEHLALETKVQLRRTGGWAWKLKDDVREVKQSSPKRMV